VSINGYNKREQWNSFMILNPANKLIVAFIQKGIKNNWCSFRCSKTNKKKKWIL